MAEGSGGTRNPSQGSEVTREWLVHALTAYERRSDPGVCVEVIEYQVNPGTKPGENVASELAKIWVKAELCTEREREGRCKEDMDASTNTTIKEPKGNEPTTSTTTAATTMETENKEPIPDEDDKATTGTKNESMETGNEVKPRYNTRSNTQAKTNKAQGPDVSGRSSTNPTSKEYNLMAKFNTGTEFDREFVNYHKTDLKELLIYSDVIRELNAFQESAAGGRYPMHVPEFVYGVCDGDASVLIMQDVSVLGYKTMDKTRGLDLPHVLMAAEHLARLHAVSHAYNHKHDFLKRFPSFETDDRSCKFFAYFNAIFYEQVIDVLNERPDLDHLAGKMRSKRDELFGKLEKIMSRNSDGHRVVSLAHGDAWTNNLMYSHWPNLEIDEEVPKSLHLIDWGLVTWGNPILDLHQVVYNCTSLQFRREHLGGILRHYHEIFTAATTDLGAPVLDYNFASFMDEWNRTAVFGFVRSGIFANAIVLSNKAREGFVKGKASTGLKSLLLKCMAKIMVPLLMQGWFWGSVKANTMKGFEALFEELRSGVNRKLNDTLIDIIIEAEENGLLD